MPKSKLLKIVIGFTRNMSTFGIGFSVGYFACRYNYAIYIINILFLLYVVTSFIENNKNE